MKIISVIGPTAIGKTRLAIDLAKHYQTEIISSDSRQFYREMTIGTAKPSREELNEVPHHFINSLSIFDEYSVGHYEKEAISLIEKLSSTYNVVIMVGGSPLYEKAVLWGLDDFPEIPVSIREKWRIAFKNHGITYLQTQLQEKDSVYFQKVDKENPHRLIRALEVIELSGKPYSRFLNQPKKKRSFLYQRIGIQAPREKIYERINQRVEVMRDLGLTHEAQGLYEYRDLNALQTVGYQEIFRFLNGEYSEDFAYEEIKKNSRRFAKRQLTWYRNQENEIDWVDWDQTEEMLKKLR